MGSASQRKKRSRTCRAQSGHEVAQDDSTACVHFDEDLKDVAVTDEIARSKDEFDEEPDAKTCKDFDNDLSTEAGEITTSQDQNAGKVTDDPYGWNLIQEFIPEVDQVEMPPLSFEMDPKTTEADTELIPVTNKRSFIKRIRSAFDRITQRFRSFIKRIRRSNAEHSAEDVEISNLLL